MPPSLSCESLIFFPVCETAPIPSPFFPNGFWNFYCLAAYPGLDSPKLLVTFVNSEDFKYMKTCPVIIRLLERKVFLGPESLKLYFIIFILM